jgi:hypothetical protein
MQVNSLLGEEFLDFNEVCAARRYLLLSVSLFVCGFIDRASDPDDTASKETFLHCFETLIIPALIAGTEENL